MNLFSFIKGRLSIADVVNEYTTLKKTGLYLKGLCPFHHEKTASFTVSPHKEIFYCFGCHAGGDVIAFIEKAEQCSPLEAAFFLSDRHKIEIPDHLRNETETIKPDERSRYWQLCAAVANWCHTQLFDYKEARHYLHTRGITDEIIKKFKLGVFPGAPLAIKKLLSYLQQEQFLLHDLLVHHIIIDSKTMLYSPFADRIIFPIKNQAGHFCGFGGRTFKNNDERPKYYNSKENPYFNKGSLLFGLDSAKPVIQKTGTIFLVEGYIDCLVMAQQGYINCVATLGTAANAEQLALLSRYGQELILVYDGDEAGQKAMLRIAQWCWQVNLELNVVELPPNSDPASFANKPKAEFQELFAAHKNIFVFFVEQSSKEFQTKTMADKLEIVRSFIAIIHKIEDPLKQDILLQKASQVFNMPYVALQKELKRITGGNNLPVEPISQEGAVQVLKEIPPLEKKLFSVIINNIAYVKEEDLEYLQEYLSSPLQELLRKCINQGKELTTHFNTFFDTLEPAEKQLVAQLMAQTFSGKDTEKEFDYLLMQFQRQHWKSFVASIKLKLARAVQAGSKEEEAKILQSFQELKKKLLIKGLI